MSDVFDVTTKSAATSLEVRLLKVARAYCDKLHHATALDAELMIAQSEGDLDALDTLIDSGDYDSFRLGRLFHELSILMAMLQIDDSIALRDFINEKADLILNEVNQ